MSKARVPAGMLLDGAQMSISALVAGTMGFLKERNIPITEWVSYIGERFEDSLSELKEEPVDKVMQHLLELEILPLGAELISTESDGSKAEAIITPLPGRTVLEKFGTTPRELLSGFEITQQEFESILDMFEPAARSIGLGFSHRSKNGQLYLSLAKTTARRRTSRKQSPDGQADIETVNTILSDYEHELGGNGSSG